MVEIVSQVGVVSWWRLSPWWGGHIPSGYVVSLVGAISLVEPDGGHIPARCAVPGGGHIPGGYVLSLVGAISLVSLVRGKCKEGWWW